MPKIGEDGMWSVVMFDLPVKTRTQTRGANRFRSLLLDLGYFRAQFSVYVRYLPTGTSGQSAIRSIKANLPAAGEVRIVHITDRQWSKGLRFVQKSENELEEKADQLTIF